MSDKNTLSQALTSAIRHPDYKREIAVLLRGNLAPGQLQKKLEDYHERDIAEALELLRRDERRRAEEPSERRHSSHDPKQRRRERNRGGGGAARTRRGGNRRRNLLNDKMETRLF